MPQFGQVILLHCYSGEVPSAKVSFQGKSEQTSPDERHTHPHFLDERYTTANPERNPGCAIFICYMEAMSNRVEDAPFWHFGQFRMRARAKDTSQDTPVSQTDTEKE